MGKFKAKYIRETTAVTTESLKHSTAILPCAVCFKTFKSHSTLKRHMNFHAGSDVKKSSIEDSPNDMQKPVMDDSGHDSFTKQSSVHKSSRENDEISHDTSKIGSSQYRYVDLYPYECAECLDCFAKEEYLSAHLEFHKSNPSKMVFSCKVCDQTFTYRTALNRHILSHDGGPPYKCVFCKETFDNVNARSKHTKKHLIWCGVCDLNFPDLGELRDHFWVVHKKKKLPQNRTIHNEIKLPSYGSKDFRGKYETSVNTDNQTLTDQWNHVSFTGKNINSNMPEMQNAINFGNEFLCVGNANLSPEKKMHESTLRGTFLCPKCAGIFPSEFFFKQHSCLQSTSGAVPTIYVQNPNLAGSVLINAQSNPANAQSILSNQLLVPGNAVSNISSTQDISISQTTLSSTIEPPQADPSLCYSDFNANYYVPWMQGFVEVCKVIEYPLPSALIGRVRDCIKSLSDVLVDPPSKLKEKDNFVLAVQLFDQFNEIFKKQISTMADPN